MGSYLRHRWWIPSAVSLSVKPALHRSVWFWLGCFVLLFLVWAWVDSYETGTLVYRQTLVAKVKGPPAATSSPGPMSMYYETPIVFGVNAAGLESGRIVLSYTSVSNPGPGVVVQRGDLACRRSAARTEFLPPMFLMEKRHDTGVKTATVLRYGAVVPVWGVVVLYVMLCAGVLVWWRRRVRGVNIERETSNDE